MGYLEGSYGSAGGGSGAVSSVANSDGTLTISPTTGSVVASIALTHANLWTGVQTLELPIIADATDSTKSIGFTLSGATTGAKLTIVSAQTASHNLTIPQLGGPDTLPTLAVTQTWTGTNTFTNSTVKILGSSTGATTFTSANASATNYTLTTPACTGDVLATAGSASETLLTTTNPTNIVTFTPAAAGNYNCNLYARIITGSTVITAVVTWTDVTGAQTYTWLTGSTQSTGSYVFMPVFINSAASQAITITVTAGTANQIYATAAITAM